MITHSPFKAAVVQAAPVFLNCEATVDKSVSLIEEAARNGASLIAFPEVWVPGYPWWIWLGSPAWAAGSGFVRRYFDNSLVYGSPAAERLRQAATANGIHVFMGLSERDGGSLYMAQWLIGPAGEDLIKRRKLKPTHAERYVFGCGDGSDLVVVDTSLGRVGGLCCWEHLQPLSKYAMYSMSEQIHVAAWPSFSNYDKVAYALRFEPNNGASQTYAVEGSCFVLAPSTVVSKEMIDSLCDTPDKHELIHAGGGHAVGFGPDGSPLFEKKPEDWEGLLYADIDVGNIAMAKAATDPSGHYSRPDVTRLLLNRRKQPAVQEFSLPMDVQPDL